MEDIKEIKRKSITITLIIIYLIMGGLVIATIDNDLLSSFIAVIVPIIAEFIVAYGLINDRVSSVGEVFSNIKNFTGKIFFINILIMAISFILTSLVSATTTLITSGSFRESAINNVSSITGITILIMIVQFLFNIFTVYTNFYLSNKNTEQETVGTSIKNIFRIGKDNISKTLISILKYIVAPSLIVVFIITLIMSLTFGKDPSISIIVTSILAIIGSIVMIAFQAKLLISYYENFIEYKNLESEDM
ncbi:MAG: hypothetical protein Q4B36_06900 [Tissierellia bacterium]|nr:hypothetical protein [Tissierellia bacterium]